MSVGHTGSKFVAVGLLPAGTPKDDIKVYDRQTKPLPELAGYGRLTATGAAEDNDAPQTTLPTRVLPGVLMPEDMITLSVGHPLPRKGGGNYQKGARAGVVIDAQEGPQWESGLSRKPW